MLRIFLLVASAVSASDRNHYSDQMNKSLESLNQIGPAIERGNERKRQMKLDSMQRINDSLEADMRRAELELKLIELDRARRRAQIDSLNFARDMEKRARRDSIAAATRGE